MISDSEKKVIEQYFSDLRDLSNARMLIDYKMNRVETGIRAILALSSDDEVTPYLERLDDIVRPEGFTDAVRRLLRSSDEALTPVELRAKLPDAGFSLTDYSNPLASIHTILKRLVKTGEARMVLKGDKTAYLRTAGLPAPIGPDHPLHKLRANPRGRTVPPPPGLDALAGIPNRFGTTLGEMLKQPEKKK